MHANYKSLYTSRETGQLSGSHIIWTSMVSNGSEEEILFPNKRTSTDIHKEAKQQHWPMFGALCFALCIQKFPYLSYFSCALSNKNWISEVGNGWVREATLLASGLHSHLGFASYQTSAQHTVRTRKIFDQSNHYCSTSRPHALTIHH